MGAAWNCPSNDLLCCGSILREDQHGYRDCELVQSNEGLWGSFNRQAAAKMCSCISAQSNVPVWFHSMKDSTLNMRLRTITARNRRRSRRRWIHSDEFVDR